jgi:hypothetical protein
MLGFSPIAAAPIAAGSMAQPDNSQPIVIAVIITPSAATLAGSATQQFSASVVGLNNPSQGVTWSSAAGSINASGVLTAPATTPNHQYVKVTATSTQDSTKSVSVIVTVIGSNPSTGKGIFQTRRHGARRVQRIS